MKIQPLYDLQQEMNRLYIAGGKFAHQDPRLAKLVPSFEKLGEKAPVFKKIATDLNDLINTAPNQANEKLLALGTLLYAVLYTQGENCQATEKQPQKPLLDIHAIATNFSYFELKPYIHALTVAGSGREGVLKEGLDSGVFKDFRLYSYLDQALSDKNYEVSQFVAQKIIPACGEGILPILLKNFQYQDTSENVKRLGVLIDANHPSVPGLVTKILQESLPKLQAESIRHLMKSPEHEDLILTLAEDKNKIVREAALMAMGTMNTSKSVNRLMDLFTDLKNKTMAKLEPVVQALAMLKNPPREAQAFERLRSTYQQVIGAKDIQEMAETIPFMEVEVRILKNKNVDAAVQFIEETMSNPEFYSLHSRDYLVKKWPNSPNDAQISTITSGYYRILESFIQLVLEQLELEKAYQLYERNKTVLNRQYIPAFFHVCRRLQIDKSRVFDDFGKEYKKNLTTHDLVLVCETDKGLDFNRLDKRWFDVIEKQIDMHNSYEYALLHHAKPLNDAGFNEKLIQRLGKVQCDLQLLMAIAAREIPNKYNLILEAFKNDRLYWYFHFTEPEVAFYLSFPKECAPKFREIHEDRVQKKHRDTLERFAEIADTLMQR